MIGTSLSHYRITEKLGQGGKGEVYRARNERLGRDAAIKVLPGPVADDPERMARFEREARALAALSRPNILAIFDFGKEYRSRIGASESSRHRSGFRPRSSSPRRSVCPRIQIRRGALDSGKSGLDNEAGTKRGVPLSVAHYRTTTVFRSWFGLPGGYL